MIKILKTVKNPKRPSAGKIAFMFMSVSAFILILINPEKSIEYMTYGLDVCANVVIPSLFPFMIISSLLIESGVGEYIGKLLSKPMRFLFGISGNSASAIILGNLCGFPIGAQAVASLLDDGCISETEARRVLTFVNNPSSAFVISAVGLSLWSNKKLGGVLYFICLLSSLIIAFATRFFMGSDKCAKTDAIPQKSIPTVTAFTHTVSSSAVSILTVCAYVTFFSAITGSLSYLLSLTGLGKEVYAVIVSFAELSSGVSVLSSLDDKTIAALLTAFALGWSGISVHCQVMSMFKKSRVSFKPYLIAKFAQGCLNAAFLFAYLKFIDASLLLSAKDTASPAFFNYPQRYRTVILVCFSIICVSAFLAFMKQFIKKTNEKKQTR